MGSGASVLEGGRPRVACLGGGFGYTYDFPPETETIEELAFISALESGLLEYTGTDAGTVTALRTLSFTLRAPVGIAVTQRRQIANRLALYAHFRLGQ